MKTFDVYNLWPIEPTRALGCHVWDIAGQEYLDFYGGHAVISIGHCHPRHVAAVQQQAEKLCFYSNSVENPLQTALAELLGRVSGMPDYSLFLCNSGAEANENALKLASFHTGRDRVLAFNGAFHGRTSGAVAATDNPRIISPFNARHRVTFVPLDDIDAARKELATGSYAAAIIEGIQGVAGIHEPGDDFLRSLREACTDTGTVLVLDEVQSGYGRTGHFFAHQRSGVRADLVTMAKGMGNGFPIGGVLVAPHFKAVKGMLGTTFGGNHLACAAAIAVLQVIEDEGVVQAVVEKGKYLHGRLSELPGIGNGSGEGADSDAIRGRGLMLGLTVGEGLRDRLLFDHHVFTGGAAGNVMRLLPPLTVTYEEIDVFIERFKQAIL